MNVRSLIYTAGIWGGLGLAATARVDAAHSPIPENPQWKRYILDVQGEYVTPKTVSIEGTAAEVKNPDGFIRGAGGGTTLTTTKAGSTRLIVDLGMLASGYVELKVSHASGAAIRMAYSEMRESLHEEGDASTDKDDFFFHGRTLGTDDDPDGRSDVFQPPAGPATLTSPGLRGSQRYVAVTLDGPGTVTIESLRVRQTNFRGSYDGHFLSNDEDLNRAWYASAYAVDLSTVRDTRKTRDAGWVLIDGPKRDRVVYAQDLGISGLSAYYQGVAFNEVMGNSIRLFGCQQWKDGTFPAASVIDVPCPKGDPGPPGNTPKGFDPPGEVALARLDSFTAWWVIILDDYLRYTGDQKTVADLLPAARRAVQFFADHAPDGVLWKADNYGDKLAFNWHTPDKTAGIDAFGNEAYYGALRSLAQMERAVAHDEPAAKKLEERAAKVKAALFERLWDPAAGAFLLNTDNPRRNHPADANAGALMFGLLTPQQARQVMDFLQKKLGTPYGTATGEFSDDPYMTRYVSPYILAVESLGRFRYGDGAGALKLMRTAWTHMLKMGPGTPWEEIGMQGKPVNARPGTSITTGEMVDAAHAWSTAVPALSMFVLGVTPVTDGYRYWSIKPTPVDLKWAQGDVPTPAGSITVRWVRGDGDGSFTLTTAAPKATSGRVAVPLLNAPRTITLDGQVAWQNEKPVDSVRAHRDGDWVVFDSIAEGQHTFGWAR